MLIIERCMVGMLVLTLATMPSPIESNRHQVTDLSQVATNENDAPQVRVSQKYVETIHASK